MKLVDKNLKEIFKKGEINDFITAFAYLSNSGCYTRLSVISNCLYYFKKETINNYKFIIKSYNENNNTISLEFLKLNDTPHIIEYLEYCLNNSDSEKDLHEYAYDSIAKIEEIDETDCSFLLSFFDGKIITRHDVKNHKVIGGIIMDNDANEGDMMAEENEVLRTRPEVMLAEEEEEVLTERLSDYDEGDEPRNNWGQMVEQQDNRFDREHIIDETIDIVRRINQFNDFGLTNESIDTLNALQGRLRDLSNRL